MLGGDWLEQERSGYDVDRESTGDDSHATVRSQIKMTMFCYGIGIGLLTSYYR